MAGAWHDGAKGGESYVNSSSLLDAISRAVDFWFANDFTVPGCLDSGGRSPCPCGTPGFWNINWFSNVRKFFDLLCPPYHQEKFADLSHFLRFLLALVLRSRRLSARL